MLDFSIKYDEPFDVAYQRHLRELRDFARRCREALPLPSYEQLTSEQRVQYGVLREKMEQFTPYSSFSEKHVAILHSTPVGLLAASEVYKQYSDCMVLLLLRERKEWVRNPEHFLPGLFWTLWWNFPKKVSPNTNYSIRRDYPLALNETLWQLNFGRGGSASCEIWCWNGERLSFVCKYGGICEEDYHVTDDSFL